MDQRYLIAKGDYFLVSEPIHALEVLKAEPGDKNLDYSHPVTGLSQRHALECMLQAFIDKGPAGLLPQNLPPDVLYTIGTYEKQLINLYVAAVAYIKNDRSKDGRYKIDRAKFIDWAVNYKVACQTEYVWRMGYVDLTHPPTVDTVLDVPQKERTEIIYTEEAEMEYQRMEAGKN